MIRTYAYQLKPTKTQVRWLFDRLERLRDLQNSVRNGRMAAYEAKGITLSYADQGKELTRARDTYYKAVPQDFQNHVLRRVDKAFKNFFRRVKNVKHRGFHAIACTIGLSRGVYANAKACAKTRFGKPTPDTTG